MITNRVKHALAGITNMPLFEILLLLSIFFIPVKMTVTLPYVENKVTLSEFFFVFATISFFVSVIKRKQSMRFSWKILPLVLMFLSTLVLFAYNLITKNDFYYFDLAISAYFLVFVFILYNFLRDSPKAYGKFVSAIFYSGVFVSVFSLAGIVLYILKFDFNAISELGFLFSESNRLVSTLANPNYASLLFGALGIFFLATYFKEKKKQYLYLSLFMIFSNFFTFSRAGLVSSFIVLAGFFIYTYAWKKFDRKTLLKIACIILILSLVAVAITFPKVKSRVRSAVGVSAETRNEIVGCVGTDYFHIFGLSTLQIKEIIKEETGKYVQFHNLFLTSIFRMGILGIVFLLSFFGCIAHSFQEARKSRKMGNASFALLLVITFIILWGMFHDLNDNKILWLFYSAVIALPYLKNGKNKSPPHNHPLH